MASFSGKFDSLRQDWPTPQSLFDGINAEFNFTLDAAASGKNKKCDLYIGEDTNSLAVEWGRHTVWLNPPYGAKSGSLQQWVQKAYSASLKGATVVMLIPARTNTNWFHDICLSKGEVRFVRGRPKFGEATHGLPQPLCYVIFRPNYTNLKEAYKDAVSGLRYIKQNYPDVSGVGYDRVEENYQKMFGGNPHDPR